jgi:hypothetical protein
VGFALAGAIRDIRTPENKDKQVLMIYDDGGEGDPGHAVLRAIAGVQRHVVTEARRQLLRLLQFEQLPE